MVCLEQIFKQNIIFEVDRIRDGKSFTTRRVNAIQNGEAIFSCSISFQKREKGLKHQIKMPKIQGPEGLKSDLELRKDLKSKIPKDYLPMWLREREIETRQVEPVDLLRAQTLPPYRSNWMKPTGKLPSDERIHQALLLYVSDMGLLGAAVNPHEVNFMSKKCELTGKIPLKGHKVSHANNKTKRRFLPNLKKVKFKSEILNKSLRLTVSNAAMRSVDKKGSFDQYLKEVKIKKLSPRLKKIKKISVY